MRIQVCPSQTIQLAAHTYEQFRQLNKELNRIENLSPLDIALLRVLVVHGWRRIVLRVPCLPDRAFPEEWCGQPCRALVGGAAS